MKRAQERNKREERLEQKLLFYCASWDLLQGAHREKLRTHTGWGSHLLSPSKIAKGVRKKSGCLDTSTNSLHPSVMKVLLCPVSLHLSNMGRSFYFHAAVVLNSIPSPPNRRQRSHRVLGHPLHCY